MKITVSNGKRTIEIEAKAVAFTYTPEAPKPQLPPIVFPKYEWSLECDISHLDPFALAVPTGDPKEN